MQRQDGTGNQRQSMAAQNLQGQSLSQFEDYGEDFTVDDRSSLLAIPKHHISSNQQQNGKAPTHPILLLKPNGMPVFDTMDSKHAKQMSSIQNHSQATMEETFDGKSNQNVRAHSFVVGKKVSNITSINLFTAESQAIPGEERPNPLKIIFQKPSIAKPSSQPPATNNRPTGYQDPPKYPPLKVVYFKKAVDQQAVKPKVDVKVKPNLQTIVSRPKSAISKPPAPSSSDAQSSAVSKQRPQSAKTGGVGKFSSIDPSIKKNPIKTEATLVYNEKENIPFAENRMKGQFESITKELVKKANEVLAQKKTEKQRRKDEIAMKKEQQRLITQQVKEANQELVQRQKERGLTEHVDFRKLEEEQKEQQWREENRKERERKKEIRNKRKQERDAQLGLDNFDEELIEEYKMKKRSQLEKEIPLEEPKKAIKGGVIAPIPSRPKSSGAKMINEDLKQINQSLNQVQQLDKQLLYQEEGEKKRALKLEREAILKEQQIRRKERELEEQLKTQQAKLKKEENLRKLKEQFEAQKRENLQRQEIERRLKEERDAMKKMEKEELKQRKAYERKRAIPEGSPVPQQEEQYMELSEWIDEQIQSHSNKKRKVEDDSEKVPGVTKVQVSGKAQNQKRAHSGLDLEEVVNLNYGTGDFSKSGAQQSQVIPGNNELDFAELQKFEGRQNRYGIFGDNGYQDYIEIHKRPTPTITKAKNVKETSISPSQNEVKLSKESVLMAFQRIQNYHEQKQNIQNDQKDDLDQIESPVKSPLIPGQERRILNLIHREYAKNFEKAPNIVPGVVNIQSELQKNQQEELQIKTKATIVIQKWARGMLARARTRKIRERRQRDIEEQYGYFEDQVKFGAEYNLKKFLREKEKLRNKTNPKLTSSANIVESDSIVERIGDSSSMGSRIPIVLKSGGVAVSQSLGRKLDRAMVQNYFPRDTTRITQRDENSIINIMLRQQLPKIGAVKSPVKLDSIKKSPSKPAKKAQVQHRKGSDEIEEDIISEQIEGEEPIIVGKKNLAHKNDDGSESISEDIIMTGSQKQSSESNSKDNRPFQQLRSHQPFASKGSSIGESIQEDIMFSAEKRTPNKQTASYDKHSTSSIAEDSNLLQAEASRGSSSKQKNSGAIDESIHESVIEEDEGLNSGSSANIPKSKKIDRDRVRREHETEKERSNKQIEEFKQNIENDRIKRDKLVSEMLGELNRYEASTTSTLVLERMEKVISKSLAQKDMLILGQRLNELGLEKRHQEEIAKIREEQIRLLHQLLMAGGAGGAGMTEKERKDIMENFQKIMEKPIVIEEQKQATRKSSNPSKSLSKISESSIKESISFKDNKNDDNDSIIDEVEEDSMNKRESSSGDQIPESLPYDESAASAKLTKLRQGLGSEEAIRQQSKNTLHSNIQKLTGGPFNKHSFNDMQEEKFKQLLQSDTHQDSLLKTVEKQIEAYKAQAHRDLEAGMHTPRTHHRKGEEIEKWAYAKKIELHRQMEPIHEQYQSMIESLKKDKERIMHQIGVSPRNRDNLIDGSSSLSYRDIEDDISGESDRMKNVRDQISHLAAKRHDLLLSANSYPDPSESAMSFKEDKNIKKKKALAKKLVEEKEGLIKQGLKSRLREMEGARAEKMLSVAMNLDPEREIEKRLEEYKRRQMMIETSGEGVEDSARMSQSYGASMGKIDESTKSNKKVHFTGIKTTSPDQKSTPRQQKNSNVPDSIGEDIPFEEESISESMPAGSVSQSHDKKSLASSVGSQSMDKKSRSNSHKSDASQYSEDFIEQSLPPSSRRSTPAKKLSSHQNTQPDEEDSIDEDYSQDGFDPSQSKSNHPLISESKPSDSNNTEKSGSEETIQRTESWKQSSHPGTEDAPPDHLQDKEIVDSSKSVEWQINLIQERKQKEESPPKKEPEAKPASPPKSEVEESINMDEVDEIVEELMEMMTSDIQNDPELIFDKPLEEEQFKHKFPFNIKPPEPEPPVAAPRVTVQSVAAAKSNEPPPKTQEQLAREKYESEIKKLNDRYQQQANYIEMIIENIDREELMEQLEKPLETDPLKKLTEIFTQEADDSHIQHNETLNPNTLLSLDFFSRMEVLYSQKYEESKDNNSTTVHHKALFDSLNAALDNERPYKEKGQPFPWSKQTRVVRKKIGKAEVDKIFQKTKTKVLDMCKTNAGTIITPPPAPQTSNPDDPQANQPVSPIVFEQQQKDRLTALKEERLGTLMVRDLEENEHTWLDYEEEDTMVKFDLADMILDVLNAEVAQFLFAKQQN